MFFCRGQTHQPPLKLQFEMYMHLPVHFQTWSSLANVCFWIECFISFKVKYWSFLCTVIVTRQTSKDLRTFPLIAVRYIFIHSHRLNIHTSLFIYIYLLCPHRLYIIHSLISISLLCVHIIWTFIHSLISISLLCTHRLNIHTCYSTAMSLCLSAELQSEHIALQTAVQCRVHVTLLHLHLHLHLVI